MEMFGRLSWFGGLLNGDDPNLVVCGRLGFATVKYCENSFLRAVNADTDEYVSGKDIAAHGNEITDS